MFHQKYREAKWDWFVSWFYINFVSCCNKQQLSITWHVREAEKQEQKNIWFATPSSSVCSTFEEFFLPFSSFSRASSVAFLFVPLLHTQLARSVIRNSDDKSCLIALQKGITATTPAFKHPRIQASTAPPGTTSLAQTTVSLEGVPDGWDGIFQKK